MSTLELQQVDEVIDNRNIQPIPGLYHFRHTYIVNKPEQQVHAGDTIEVHHSDCAIDTVVVSNAVSCYKCWYYRTGQRCCSYRDPDKGYLVCAFRKNAVKHISEIMEDI